MPKLTDSALGYFELDALPHQKGSVRVVVKGSNVGLTMLTNNKPLVAPIPFGDWTDAGDSAYGSVALLLAAFRTFLFQVST